GTVFTIKSLWVEIIEKIDLVKDARKFSVPVYFIVGRYDYNTPFELAEQYFKKIQAPKKEFIWFEKSAHSPNFEEPEKFDEVMIEKVLKEVKLAN
ncbi:MAG: alpha/beta hydrolase, partial [Candidatus Heimdallarchaeota archaeon]|nr:alpha/beta hydrolase [Candidatus Heimdallarchaeota archaeon]